MTSKNLFFKQLKQNIKEKAWMFILSFVTHILFLPIAFMIYMNQTGIYEDMKGIETELYSFCGRGILVLGVLVAYCGAVIVGFFEFDYLFKKNRVDTYHSIPVKRSKLYLVHYVSGVLAWAVPYFISMILAFIFSMFYVESTGVALGTVLSLFIRAIGYTTLVFFLIYHLILLTVMLTGNEFNCISLFVIFGCSIAIMYGVIELILSGYLETYIQGSIPFDAVVWLSPIVSSIRMCYDGILNEATFGGILLNIVVCILMGFGAYGLYLKRPSEVSEQGLYRKKIAAVIKIVISFVAGLCGWIFFSFISGEGMQNLRSFGRIDNTSGCIFGIFGAVLGSVFAFGCLNMIFSMEWKSFFKSKLIMLVTALVSAAFGFSCYADLFHYNSHIADEENIKSLSIDCNFGNITNRGFAAEYTDEKVIYEFLKRGVDNYNSNLQDYEDYKYKEDVFYVTAKVTPKFGLPYYRRYYYSMDDFEYIEPILLDEEYLKDNYMIPEDVWGDKRTEMSYLSNLDGSRQYVLDGFCLKIAQAYNKDLMADPKKVLFGKSIRYCNVNIYVLGGVHCNFVVNEYMPNVCAVLKEYGLEEYVEDLDADSVEMVTVKLEYIDLDQCAELIRELQSYCGRGLEVEIEEDVPEPNAGTVTLYITDFNVIKNEIFSKINFSNETTYDTSAYYGVKCYTKNGRQVEASLEMAEDESTPWLQSVKKIYHWYEFSER